MLRCLVLWAVVPSGMCSSTSLRFLTLSRQNANSRCYSTHNTVDNTPINVNSCEPEELSECEKTVSTTLCCECTSACEPPSPNWVRARTNRTNLGRIIICSNQRKRSRYLTARQGFERGGSIFTLPYHLSFEANLSCVLLGPFAD